MMQQLNLKNSLRNLYSFTRSGAYHHRIPAPVPDWRPSASELHVWQVAARHEARLVHQRRARAAHDAAAADARAVGRRPRDDQHGARLQSQAKAF